MEESYLEQRCVIIGGSAGSLQVVQHILNKLKPGFQLPVIIVLHRKTDHTSGLTDVFNYRSTLPVKEAEDKEIINPGTAYVAPADYHLLIEKDLSFSLDGSEKVHYSRPSIDVSFDAASEAFGAGLIGVLLSGANADGTKGLEIIRAKGGISIVQNPASAQVPFMPKHAIESGVAGLVMTAEEISEYLNLL
ncbi:chemotaxis protein CheB [Mucilaginibacter limnophilus]|uniref:protein-glutamate methylesterase n=1 Tax=Mucilaginibacter limnophilus TaxID=1932778 RepID=A0A437MRV8_9SPHI|nr:chemotaxis protein CheB [Mucilaginibacter limnophilus]RVU00365.1 chemotaxis protein CheB [Mucilaginibacter limnophilus]